MPIPAQTQIKQRDTEISQAMEASLAQTLRETLAAHHDRVQSTTLREKFAADPDRFSNLSFRFQDLLADFSKENLDASALEALVDMAADRGVEAQRDAMFSGARFNNTEDRGVLHTALRAPRDLDVTFDGNSVAEDIHNVLDSFLGFADAVRSGAVVSGSGKRFTDIVNIGIGGSDLGPAMVVRALSPYQGHGPHVHFVSNVDGAHLRDVTAGLDPETTLVIIASKTFTTQETMANATAARAWLADNLGERGAKANLCAISTNVAATGKFGVPSDRVFGFWDWVGGRYSIWSAIGLPVAIAIGVQNFRDFLSGAHDLDRHFQTAPLNENLPVLMALVGIWRRNVLGYSTVALIPYEQRLERFPAYVQQLDMESNGKGCTRNGDPLSEQTGPVIWGEPGTNAQHSFFQLIHQGTSVIPVDFVLSARPRSDLADQHDLLIANCLAQSEALAFGKTAAEAEADLTSQGLSTAQTQKLAPHKTFPGNRPSTIILQSELSPYTLGRLIALFEHKVFVQGVIWGVNPFDQWGVELGKSLAKEIAPLLTGGVGGARKDSSTLGLIKTIHNLKNA